MSLRVAVTPSAFVRDERLVEELSALELDELRLNRTGRRLARAELLELLRRCDAVILGTEPLDGELLDRCPELRMVAKFGVGMDNVDVGACASRGVRVGHTPGTNRRSVAEQALASMIFLCRNLYPAAMALRAGRWEKQGGRQLTGGTVGVIGLGHVGREVCRLLRVFDCRILGNDIEDRRDFCSANGVREATKSEIYAESDVVTLHVPLTAETERMIDASVLRAMKRDAFLVNTARGGIVVEKDLKEALAAGEIAGAAIDVYEEEPPMDAELLRMDRLICTPHIGGNAREAVRAMGRAAIQHVERFARARG